MKAKRLVVLLVGLAGIVGVWMGLMAQSRETTYIVFLREKVSPSALVTMKGNRVAVKRTLMETAKRTQSPLLSRLQQWQKEGKVQQFRSLWIVNAISVRATSEVIEVLKRDPLVEKVVQARPVRLVQPIRHQGGIRPRQAFTWGLEKIRVPEVWNAFGIQGANVTVGVIDTGIAADHPDLVGKLRPVNGWFDPYGDTPSPSDWDGHGTHVSGTIAGGNASGTHIGVAPQATLIVAQLFNEWDWPPATEAEVLACMQWMMDPDGDPNTNDGADVVNNSWGWEWGSDSPNMNDPIKDALNAWIAANIVPVFAIGNDGPSPRTTGSPGDYPMAFGVGATDSNDNIAVLSSRGPVFWEGIGEIIKPDVSAPGVDVYSSVPPWGYEYLSGTSMASPHVAGTVALMISYARNQGISLSVDTIKQLLKATAVDLGQSGPDNDYGWGRIDAFAALMSLAPDANEPNDDPSTATQIAYGDAVSGAINPSGDVDYYKFDGQEGDYVTISVEAYNQWWLNAALTLYDSDGQTVLAFNDNFPDWMWWWWNYNPRIVRFPLPHSGTFYLKVENVWGDGGSGIEYTYTLTLVMDTHDDHSDWPVRATPIISGQPINGTIDPELDSDYFVFEAQAGYFATAEVFAQREGSVLVAILALYNERGEQIAWSEGWWWWDPYIEIQLPATGRYYLRVMPSEWGSLGGPNCAYRISLTLQPGPQISVTPASIEETLLQGSKSVVSLNVTNVGGSPLTFLTRSATSAISTLTVQQPARRRIMVVPETSKLYQNYLRMQQQRQQKAMPTQGSVKSAPQNVFSPEKQRELQQVIQKLLAKRNPNSQRLAQALQDSMRKPSVSPSQPINRTPRQVKPAPFQFTPDPNTEHSVELIPLKGGKPISILQNEQPPSGTWRRIIVDPDEYDDAINVTKVSYQSDGTYLYFRAELDGGGFDPQNASFNVFLDTDRNAGTGNRIVEGMGIDYILYGGLGTVGVFKFNPATGGFDQVANFVWFKAVNGAVEVGVKLSDIGNPLDFYVACEFYDSNTRRWDRIPDIWYAPITRDVPWLDRSPVAGSLLAGEGVNIEVTLDATSLGLGVHRANLVFNSNDLEKQQLVVPVTLTVMQVPNAPKLISPADGAIVRPQVTFVLKSTDPDGDRVKFVIEARKGNEVKTYETTEFVESGQEASLTVEGLSSGEWTWKAKAIDERGQESSFSSEQTFIVNQLPSKPKLIAPSNNDIVLPTPTFKVRGTDDDGDALKFKLVVKQGEQIVAVFDQTQQTVGWDKESYQSGEEATFTVPTNQRLTAGTYSWIAYAFDGKEWSEASDGRVIIVNQVVSVPELISPVAGAIVRPVVTFKMKSTDPDGDRVKFVIEARKGNEVKTYETEFVESGQEASLTVEGLSSGEWTWKAKAIDERGQESSFSSEQTFIVNQLPSKPELIEPSNNAIVSPTPTFKLKSTDVDGDQVKLEIEVTKGSRVEVLVTNFVNSGTDVSITVPEDQALSPGQWTWKARAIDERGEAGEWSETRTIQVISVPSIKSGLRLVACPVIGPTDPKSAFAFDGDKWAWYDPTTSRYLQYPDAQTNLQVGKGYWAKFVQETKPNVEGNLPDTTQPFSIALKQGWNLIGNPWLVDLGWDLSSIKVKVGGQEKALKDLRENEGVEPYAWRWDGSNYRLVFDRTIITGVDYTLPSWEGAWVYAHTDCELVLPPPSQSKGRGTRDRGQVAKGNGWSMRLQALVNGSVGEAVIGIANGTRGLAVGLPPEPPTGNNGVQVILLKNNTPLAVDVRSDGSRKQEWEVLVKWDRGQVTRGMVERKEVVLTFDGIGYAPKDVSAWLVDTVTGKRLYLRTQSSYRFVAQEGEVERRFKLIVERGNERPLRVVGLKATPMRGQGVVIEFSLTKPAKVEAEVLTLTGRKVAVLDVGSGEGLTRRIVWRGVGIEGQKVGNGVYLIRVRAVDEEGREVQAATVIRLR